MTSNSKRLFLIGIDSAPLWLIKKLRKKYKLNAFGKMIDSGMLKDLESTLPPITAAAWPSIYTGKSPAEHGITNFFSLGVDYEKIIYEPMKKEAIWERLSANGIKSLLITPAMITEAPEDKDIDTITGFPLRPKYSSDEIKKDAAKFGFDGEPEIEEWLSDATMSVEEAGKLYKNSIAARVAFGKHMIKKREHGFVFVCFTETDRLQHYGIGVEKWEGLIAALYKEISDFIDWIIEENKVDEFALMVVSDHGAQPIKKSFLLNTWLVENGIAVLKEKKTDEPSGYSAAADHSAKHLEMDEEKPVTRFICASLVDNTTETRKEMLSLDMKKTLAFSSISNNPVSQLWINNSRFATPAVEEGSEEALKALIIKILSAAKGEDGKNVIKQVHDGLKYYKGFDGIAPDLLIEAAEGYTLDVNSYSDKHFAEPGTARRGDHTRYGIVGLHCEPNKINFNGLSSVTDMAPAILHYYGIDFATSKKDKKRR